MEASIDSAINNPRHVSYMSGIIVPIVIVLVVIDLSTVTHVIVSCPTRSDRSSDGMWQINRSTYIMY